MAWRHPLAVVAVAFSSACATSQSSNTTEATPSTPPSVADGERQLTLGNPLMALETLRQIDPTDPQYAYALQLIDVAKSELDAIADTWLSEQWPIGTAG